MEILDTDTLSAEVLEKALTIAGESGLLAVADAALEATSSPGQAAQIVGNVVDVLIDFETLDLGPLGSFIEAHDGDAAAWVADLVISLAMDDARRQARKVRRARRRAQRATRQADRKTKRSLR